MGTRLNAFIRFIPTSSVGANRTWWDTGNKIQGGTYWYGTDEYDGSTKDGNGVDAPQLVMKAPSGILWSTGSFGLSYGDPAYSTSPNDDNMISSSFYPNDLYDYQNGSDMTNDQLGSNVLPIFLEATDDMEAPPKDLCAGVFILTSSIHTYGTGSPEGGYISDKLLRVYHTIDTDGEGNKTYYHSIADQVQWAADNIPEYKGFIKDTGSYTELDNLINMMYQGATNKSMVSGWTASQAGLYMTASEGGVPAWYYDLTKNGAQSEHLSNYTASLSKLTSFQLP